MNNSYINSLKLKDIIRTLKANNQLPRNIQLAEIGSDFIASIYDKIGSDIITESVQTGIAGDANLAVIKALVEYIERKAFSSGRDIGLKSCQTSSSDGLAAYPSFYCTKEDAKNKSRLNAYYECFERYTWSTWWDNTSIGYDIDTYYPGSYFPFKSAKNLFQRVDIHTKLEKIYLISPKIIDTYLPHYKGKSMIIIAKLEGGGYISGGAAGRDEELDTIVFRGLAELYRHSLAINRIKQNNLLPKTFYEKRLNYFGSGQGDLLVEERLSKNNNEFAQTPFLEIDEEVPHELDNYITVHRCLFHNMTTFMGGKIERLCI